VSQNTIEGPTGELFEAKPGVYDRLLAGSQQNNAAHIYAVSPKTKIHISELGIPVPVPIQHPWRED
jgi:hypothetical protein